MRIRYRVSGSANTLNLSKWSMATWCFQTTVNGLENIGLVVKNLTRLWTNETCNRGNTNCMYHMDICFSWKDNVDCSIFKFTTKSWPVKPGGSLTLAISDTVFGREYNPLRRIPKIWRVSDTSVNYNTSKDNFSHFAVQQVKSNMPAVEAFLAVNTSPLNVSNAHGRAKKRSTCDSK